MATKNGYRDWRGTPLRKGDKVVYPVRANTGTALVEATIEEFVENKQGILKALRCRRHRETGWYAGVDGVESERPVVVTALNRVTVVR